MERREEKEGREGGREEGRGKGEYEKLRRIPLPISTTGAGGRAGAGGGMEPDVRRGNLARVLSFLPSFLPLSVSLHHHPALARVEGGRYKWKCLLLAG